MSNEREYVPVHAELFQAIGSESEWSDAVRVGDLIWIPGQLGWDNQTGVLFDGVEAQTEQALRNLKNVLERVGSSLKDVVSVRVYLTDHDHYDSYEPIYRRYFPANTPARVTVVVADLIHHALFDIEAMAVRSRQ